MNGNNNQKTNKKKNHERLQLCLAIVVGILVAILYMFTIKYYFGHKEEEVTSIQTTESSEPKDGVYELYVQITSETVNIRKMPSINAKVVAEVSDGDRFMLREEIEDENGNLWYKIRGGKISGFVPSEYVKVLKLIEEHKN